MKSKKASKLGVLCSAFILNLLSTPAMSEEIEKEGGWFYQDKMDPMTNYRSIILGISYGKGGALIFKCQDPDSKKPKIFGNFVSDQWLGKSLNLQYLYLKFDDDEAERMVGNYPGQYIAFFESSKVSAKAFERINTANRVRIRAFRYDGTPVEADIHVTPERNLWNKFKSVCSKK